MTKMQTAERPVISPAQPADDLSKLIVQSVKRETGDVVRCARVFADRYRCNWWFGDGLFEPTRVRRSAFLRATMTADGLLLEELT